MVEKRITDDDGFAVLGAEQAKASGAYYTPKIWVDRAQEYMEKYITGDRGFVFYMNPPYEKDRDMKFFQRAAQLARNFNLRSCYICAFSKPWWIAPHNQKAADDFLDEFRYIAGFCFDSREFKHITAPWGVYFSIWKRKAGEL